MIQQVPGREVWLKLPEQPPHGQESVPAISLPHSKTAECIVEVDSFTQLQVQHRELAAESPSATFSLHSKFGVTNALLTLILNVTFIFHSLSVKEIYEIELNVITAKVR